MKRLTMKSKNQLPYIIYKYILVSMRCMAFLTIIFLLTTWSFLSARDQDLKNIHYRSFKNSTQLKKYLKWSPQRQPLISAHRGGPMKGFPENALETFENALKYAPCLIECDVRLSADAVPVLMHDPTLERTSTGSGNINQLTLHQLKQLFLKDPNSNITPYRIPTLTETLLWAKKRAVLTLDIKDENLFEPVIREIQRLGVEGHTIIIVYNFQHMIKVYQLAPELIISVPVTGIESQQKLFSFPVPAENILAFVGVR